MTLCVSSFRMSNVYRLPCSICQDSLLIATFNGLTASTTRTFISLPSFIFPLGSYEDITQHFICRLITTALQFATKSVFLQKLLKAMFVLAFCAFLWIGEITETWSSVKHFLLFGNVALGSLNGKRFLDITIPHCKHSKRSNTTLRILKIHLTRSCVHIKPCWAILTREDTWDQNHCFTQQLKSVLSVCNLNFQNFHTHSFRIGAESTAASLGFLELQMKTMGKWHSNAFKKYIRIPTLQFNSMP